MPFQLPNLPYPANALAPTMSEETFSYHHGKHHAAYINNLNRMTEGTELANLSLEQVIADSAGEASKLSLFNNAAQAWNHDFFWKSMSPDGGGEPTGGVLADALADAMAASFGSYDGFREEFCKAAAGLFGSGWVWLAAGSEESADGASDPNAVSKLSILTTSNADIPLAELKSGGLLLTLDVWEHAYYLDFQNDRPSYIARWLDNLLNWEFATENYEMFSKQQSRVEI